MHTFSFPINKNHAQRYELHYWEECKKEFSLITAKHSTSETALNQFNFFTMTLYQKKEKIMCIFVHENDQKSIKIEQIWTKIMSEAQSF